MKKIIVLSLLLSISVTLYLLLLDNDPVVVNSLDEPFSSDTPLTEFQENQIQLMNNESDRQKYKEVISFRSISGNALNEINDVDAGVDESKFRDLDRKAEEILDKLDSLKEEQGK